MEDASGLQAVKVKFLQSNKKG